MTMTKSSYSKKIELIRDHYTHKIKTHPFNASIFIEFALFEELLDEYDRTREIFEKAIEKNYTNTILWKRYASFELRRHELAKCRKILERGTHVNPKEMDLWLFYAGVEEDMENVAAVEEILNKMTTEVETEDSHWHLYKFYCMFDTKLARNILEEMDAKFGSARIKVERLMGENDMNITESLVKMWQSIDEHTYKKIIGMLEKKGKRNEAFLFVKRGKYKFTSNFFKQKYKIMKVLVSDEEGDANCSALLCAAAEMEKKSDYVGAEKIYKDLLKVINKKYRTKSFVLYSKFLVRRDKLQLARKNYGKAIAQNLNIYEEYLRMERVLSERDRIRKIYEKYLEACPMNASVWLEFIEFEESMDEVERAEYLFKNALKIVKSGREIIEEEYKKRCYEK